MQKKDAPHIMPRSGNMSALNTASTDAQISVHAAQKQSEEQKILRHILVVEDDASLATLEADVLTACGYTVEIAGTGELAIAALHQSIPDLVVLDLELPGTLSGWDVLQALRSHTGTPVLLTSSETAVRKQMRIHGESRSTLDHLPKPYPMQTLLKRIERMLTILVR
jgi:DNA-binding response OmpR family regulator